MLRVLAITLVLLNVLLLTLQAMRSPVPQPVADVPVAVDQSVDNVPTIYLLDEVPGAVGLEEGTSECFSIGPFGSVEQRDAGLDLLAGSALSVAYRQTEAIVESGTWIYLPALPGAETARNMALTMRDAGLGEATVIAGGAWRNTVSLGFFTNKSLARQRHEEARSSGFKVEMRVQRKTEPRYWLDYEQRLGAPYILPVVDSAIPPELYRAIPCASDGEEASTS